MTARPQLGVLISLAVAARLFAAIHLVESADEAAQRASFPLAVAGVAAPIVLPPDAPEVVRIAARELAGDIAAVTGVRPDILEPSAAASTGPRIELVFAPDLAGRWEAFRLSTTPAELTVAASDRRGLAYGVFEISRRIGVSPWHWWADVPVPRRTELRLTVEAEPVDQPAVKYRGVFINDEDWGLEPWASKTFEPEVGNIGPKTYSRLCTLLLRLRANYLWPGMHPTTTPFHRVPGNAAAVDAHAIIVGSSHAEPMLLNNGREWPDVREKFNYLTNRDAVRAYWEQRVAARTAGESLFTIGMRGINDSPIIGPTTQAERIATLERIFADQREMLARHLGGGDPARVPQLFCPYKEVLDDYNAGLRVPDDVTLVWPDDNFGYIRRYGTAVERARSGGLGVYYHLSYSGLPLSWLWIDTLPPALVWTEMTRAYEQGARTLWIANVGDLKNTERSTEFFLDLAWHADRTDPDAPARFIRATAARDFGETRADAVATILARLQAHAFARRAEHLQWHLSLTPYQPTELNEAEIAAHLAAGAALLRDSEALAADLPAEFRDAYFELVGYPVAIIAAADERYFRAELARADIARGRSPDANLAAAEEGQRRIVAATTRYNEVIADGKWRHSVSENGYSPEAWPRFQRDTRTPRPAPAPQNVAPPAPPPSSPLPTPAGVRAGDFVECDRVVSIDAGHFTARTDLPSGAGWRAIPGLGRTGSAVTVLPSSAAIVPDSAPSLGYRFHIATGGAATLRVRLLPTFPLVPDRGLRLAVAIDDAAPHPLAVTGGFETKRSDEGMTEWQRRVLANATEAVLPLPAPLASGWHTLRLVAVDAGVVVDKIVIDLGGLHPSYAGPAETRLP